MGKLDNKVVLVTGAANGVGKAIALYVASEGAKTVCTDLRLTDEEIKSNKSLIPSTKPIFIPRIYGETLGKVVAEIQAAGGTALGIQADVSDEDCLDNIVYETRRIFSPVDVLVNCAVYNHFYPTVEYPVKLWKKGFDVTFHAPFVLSQKVLPAMMERRSGVIINITSPAAVGPGRGPYKLEEKEGMPPPNPVSHYGSAKAALERFSQGLAAEVYSYGITVAALGPSKPVVSPGTDWLSGNRPIPAHMGSEPAELMGKAVTLLATEPLDKVTGRVTYSQLILKEFGLIDKAVGTGVDDPGTGVSQL